MEIAESLISWYLREKRDLPWRHTTNPYHIWLSEIILQQTRVDQGLAYYLNFVQAFPTLEKLAEADEAEVLKLWQGLGYYSRARNLHHTAKTIHLKLKGSFPDTYEGLLALKGVGPYTAAAIASFAFNLPHAVVDGNVSRVLARFADIEEPINGAQGKRTIEILAQDLLDKSRPDTYNQAIMELGALVCLPTNPKCTECPLQAGCNALKNKTIQDRPVKIKKKKARLRHIHYAVLQREDLYLFRKRTERDIWEGLHDFFSIENIEKADPLLLSESIQAEFPKIALDGLPSKPDKVYTHLLTHQKIEAWFWKFNYTSDVDLNSIYLNIRKEDIGKLAIPRLVHKYLEDSGLV